MSMSIKTNKSPFPSDRNWDPSNAGRSKRMELSTIGETATPSLFQSAKDKLFSVIGRTKTVAKDKAGMGGGSTPVSGNATNIPPAGGGNEAVQQSKWSNRLVSLIKSKIGNLNKAKVNKQRRGAEVSNKKTVLTDQQKSELKLKGYTEAIKNMVKAATEQEMNIDLLEVTYSLMNDLDHELNNLDLKDRATDPNFVAAKKLIEESKATLAEKITKKVESRHAAITKELSVRENRSTPNLTKLKNEISQLKTSLSKLPKNEKTEAILKQLSDTETKVTYKICKRNMETLENKLDAVASNNEASEDPISDFVQLLALQQQLIAIEKEMPVFGQSGVKYILRKQFDLSEATLETLNKPGLVRDRDTSMETRMTAANEKLGALLAKNKTQLPKSISAKTEFDQASRIEFILDKLEVNRMRSSYVKGASPEEQAPFPEEEKEACRSWLAQLDNPTGVIPPIPSSIQHPSLRGALTNIHREVTAGNSYDLDGITLYEQSPSLFAHLPLEQKDNLDQLIAAEEKAYQELASADLALEKTAGAGPLKRNQAVALKAEKEKAYNEAKAKTMDAHREAINSLTPEQIKNIPPRYFQQLASQKDKRLATEKGKEKSTATSHSDRSHELLGHWSATQLLQLTPEQKDASGTILEEGMRLRKGSFVKEMKSIANPQGNQLDAQLNELDKVLASLTPQPEPKTEDLSAELDKILTRFKHHTEIDDLSIGAHGPKSDEQVYREMSNTIYKKQNEISKEMDGIFDDLAEVLNDPSLDDAKRDNILNLYANFHEMNEAHGPYLASLKKQQEEGQLFEETLSELRNIDRGMDAILNEARQIRSDLNVLKPKPEETAQETETESLVEEKVEQQVEEKEVLVKEVEVDELAEFEKSFGGVGPEAAKFSSLLNIKDKKDRNIEIRNYINSLDEKQTNNLRSEFRTVFNQFLGSVQGKGVDVSNLDAADYEFMFENHLLNLEMGVEEKVIKKDPAKVLQENQGRMSEINQYLDTSIKEKPGTERTLDNLQSWKAEVSIIKERLNDIVQTNTKNGIMNELAQKAAETLKDLEQTSAEIERKIGKRLAEIAPQAESRVNNLYNAITNDRHYLITSEDKKKLNESSLIIENRLTAVNKEMEELKAKQTWNTEAKPFSSKDQSRLDELDRQINILIPLRNKITRINNTIEGNIEVGVPLAPYVPLSAKEVQAKHKETLEGLKKRSKTIHDMLIRTMGDKQLVTDDDFLSRYSLGIETEMEDVKATYKQLTGREAPANEPRLLQLQKERELVDDIKNMKK